MEVLKEEHGSSSDSNGLATHEEGVSEEPLVSDHPKYSSSKWEKERHKLGHRKHHHHHRRKKKFHLKSPSSETEPSLDSNNGGRLHEHSFDSNCRLPEVHVSGENIPGNHVFNNSVEERCLSPHEVTPLKESTAVLAQDDRVNDLILRSRQLISDQTTVINEVPAITDICCTVTNSDLTDVRGSIQSPMTGICGSLSTKAGVNCVCSTVSSNYGHTGVCEYVAPNEYPVVPMEIGEAKPKVDNNISSSVDDLSVLSHHKSTADLGVAEVIRRSQDLLGEVCRSSTGEEKTLVAHEIDRVQDLITRSEQLLKSKGVVQSKDTTEHSPGVPVEKNESDHIQDLISRSEQLLQSKKIRELTSNQCKHSEEKILMNGSDSVKDFIPKSELKGNEITERLQPVNKQGIVKHCGPEFATEDKACNCPLTFMDKSIDLTTQPPPANHLLAKNSIIHSSVKDNSPWVTSCDHPHLKESGKRMREFLEESRTLVNSLKTDEMLEAESALIFEEKCGKIECEEQCEEFSLKKTNKKENFDKGLDGIDLNEMKSVLDQAKKLLEKSNKSSEDNAKESLEMDKSANAMDVDEIVEGNESGEGNLTRMQVDQNIENTTKDVLKDFSCFQNRVDFATAILEPLATSEQAAMFEVKLIPPLEKQTTRSNCCLARSEGSAISSDSTDISNLGGLGKCMVEKNDQFHTGDDYKQILVKKRSNDTLSETNDDNTPKHFKNNSVTLPDVNTSTAVCDPVVDTPHNGMDAEQSGKHCSEYDSKIPRLNGFNTDSLDLNVDKRLIADSNCKTDVAVSKNQFHKNGYKPGKYSPKCEPATTRHHRDVYSNTVIGHFNSNEVVDQICGNTCRMENNTRLNSKDSARLQSFYTTLKIQSIMRSRRSHREKRYDTYPF